MAVIRLSLLFLTLWLAGCGLTAPRFSDGYADLSGLSERQLQKEFSLSLGPAVLGFAADAIEDDPEAKALLAGLSGVRVRIYAFASEPDNASLQQVASDLDQISLRLGEQGWQPVMRVQEPGEATHVLMKLRGDDIAGMAVLNSDGSEVVLVNLIGSLAPALYGKAMKTLSVPSPALLVTGDNADPRI